MNEGGRGEGQLYSVHDSKTGLTYQYSYDSQGRLMSSSVTDVSDPDNPVKVITTRQTYDTNNQLSAQYWQLGSTQYSETYTYSKTTGLLATHKPAVGNTLTYGYDTLQRLSTVTGGIYGKTYTYRNTTGNNTTTQVSQLKYSLPTELLYGYTYDDLGNIAEYSENGTEYTYVYDAQNQLTDVLVDDVLSYEYSYDAAGNIQEVTDATGTHTYTYATGVWKDLLTAYDGKAITYDGSGNPTSYYNGTRWTMTWAEGRRLASASGGGKSLTFTYDSDGLRLTKKVGSTTYNYYYAGGKLLRQTGGGNTLDFFYDASGNPYALKYNNTLYYYITNLQGDVLHIVNTSGTPVVSYSYSPYGEIENVTGDLATSLGVHNPLRYRGYVYDEETELYYLQSRYYDPATCRFINADGYASTGLGIIGCNMFAYCNNSPINLTDSEGGRPVAIGLQFEITAGGATVGVEIVAYFDPTVCNGENMVIVMYTYSGSDVSVESMINMENITSAFSMLAAMELGTMEQDTILFLGKALMDGIDVSGSFFYIDGNDSFDDPIDYSGSFDTLYFTGTFAGKNAGMYYSYCDTCFAVGIKVGVSTPKARLLPIDIGYSRTEYSKPTEIIRW